MSDFRSLARWAWLFAAGLSAPLLADETPSTPRAGDEPTVAREQAWNSFVRVRRDKLGVAQALETAIVRYRPAHGHGEDYVDLVAAVHIADREYYEKLNRTFRDYDAVLYELVAPEGTRIPRGGAQTKDRHLVSQIQGGMKELLGLEHQLEVIDYTCDNLVHADMSPEEFARSMQDRGESFFQILLKMTMEGMAQQTHQAGENERASVVDLALSLVSRKKAAEVQEKLAHQWRNLRSGRGLEINEENAGRLGDLEMLLALFSGNRAQRLKRVMAEQMTTLGGSMSSLDGPEGSTIVTERNKKALQTLRRELDAGKHRVAIFYGAAHLPDMEKRLIAEFGFQRGEVRWLTAWNLEND